MVSEIMVLIYEVDEMTESGCEGNFWDDKN